MYGRDRQAGYDGWMHPPYGNRSEFTTGQAQRAHDNAMAAMTQRHHEQMAQLLAPASSTPSSWVPTWSGSGNGSSGGFDLSDEAKEGILGVVGVLCLLALFAWGTTAIGLWRPLISSQQIAALQADTSPSSALDYSPPPAPPPPVQRPALTWDTGVTVAPSRAPAAPVIGEGKAASIGEPEAKAIVAEAEDPEAYDKTDSEVADGLESEDDPKLELDAISPTDPAL